MQQQRGQKLCICTVGWRGCAKVDEKALMMSGACPFNTHHQVPALIFVQTANMGLNTNESVHLESATQPFPVK